MPTPPRRAFQEKQTFNVINVYDRNDRFSIEAADELQAKILFISKIGYKVGQQDNEFVVVDLDTNEMKVICPEDNIQSLDEACNYILAQSGFEITEGDFFGRETMGNGFSVDIEE